MYILKSEGVTDLSMKLRWHYKKLTYLKEMCCSFWIDSSEFGVSGGRAIARAVSRRLPDTACQVRAKVKSYGICGGLSGPGAVFVRVPRFPCQFSFH
jgi:hypothetical protein